MDATDASAAPQNGVCRTAQLLCASFAVMVLAACKPAPPEGISVFCESHDGDNFYTKVKSGTCPYAGAGTLPKDLPPECLDKVDSISIFKCYGKDEWLDADTGGEAEESDGASDREGIDRYDWPSHELSQANIRGYCSSKCREFGVGLDHVCEDANWDIYGYDGVNQISSKVSAEDLEDPETLNCNPALGRWRPRSATSDVVLGEQSWPSDNARIDLACQTVLVCASLFDVNIMRHLILSSPALPGVDESEAEHSVITGGGHSFMTLRTVNTDNPSEGSNPLEGRIEYTALDCNEPTCPFYLGNLTVTNTTDTWDLHAEALGADVKVSNVQVRLRGPTLGVWRPITGEVYFDEQMLDLRVDFDLAIADEPTSTVTKYGTNDGGLFGIRHHDASIEFQNVAIRAGDTDVLVTISYDTKEEK
jgi:hypothetical protein